MVVEAPEAPSFMTEFLHEVKLIAVPRERRFGEAHADARISGSPPISRANSLIRDRSRSPLSGARSAGKLRITRPLAHAMGARGNTPGIAAEIL